MGATRGRRPAGSGTREAILAAASRAFAEQGYPRTTLRGIARDAGVDTRLVTHYFGSKQDLFVEVVELPFDPDVAMATLLGPGPDGGGHRLATFAVGTTPGLVWITITAHGVQGEAANWIGFGDDCGVAAGLSAALHAATGRQRGQPEALDRAVAGVPDSVLQPPGRGVDRWGQWTERGIHRAG